MVDFLIPGSEKLETINQVAEQEPPSPKLLDQAEQRMSSCPGYQSHRMNIFKFIPELGKRMNQFSRGFSERPTESYKYISYG